MPSWNTRSLLAACLESVLATTRDTGVEIVVVDNASTDDSVAMVRESFPRVGVVTNPGNLGFAHACNQGIAATSAPYALLLNSDASLQPGALQAMTALAAQQPRCAVVGAQLRNPDGSFQASHLRFPTLTGEFLVLSALGRVLHGPWYPSRGAEEDRGPQRVDWISGACLLARRSALAEVGGLDERYFMYGEEMDLCYRMRRAGWEVWYQPAAKVLHVGSASSRHRAPEREGNLYRGRVRFFRKHYGARSAALLAAQIYAFTAAKRPLHAALRWLSGGKRGRPVIALRALTARLKSTDGDTH